MEHGIGTDIRALDAIVRAMVMLIFSRALHESWQWSERYPGHAEIRQYLNYVADKFDLKKDICFGSRVSKCTFQADENLWHVQVGEGQVYKTK